MQLRDKALDDDGLVAAARRRSARRPTRTARCSSSTTGPTSSPPAGADGVHVGQDDVAPAARARCVGPDRIVGRSTHAPEQGAAADADPDVDYLAVGPVHATPTKPGRPAAGLEYVALGGGAT